MKAAAINCFCVLQKVSGKIHIAHMMIKDCNGSHQGGLNLDLCCWLACRITDRVSEQMRCTSDVAKTSLTHKCADCFMRYCVAASQMGWRVDGNRSLIWSCRCDLCACNWVSKAISIGISWCAACLLRVWLLLFLLDGVQGSSFFCILVNASNTAAKTLETFWYTQTSPLYLLIWSNSTTVNLHHLLLLVRTGKLWLSEEWRKLKPSTAKSRWHLHIISLDSHKPR